MHSDQAVASVQQTVCTLGTMMRAAPHNAAAVLVLVAALCAVQVQEVSCGKVLVWYTEGSHWINMKPILDTLIERGHSVTMLFHNASMFVDPKDHALYDYHLFNVAMDLEENFDFFNDFMYFSLHELDQLSYARIFWRLKNLMHKDAELALKLLDGLLHSDEVMRKLKEAKYDLLFADPIYPGSELVAHILGIPFTYTLRFSLANGMERLCGQLPAPPSYVPGSTVKLTDQMSLSERVTNSVYYLMMDFLSLHSMWSQYDQYYSGVLGKSQYLVVLQ